MLVPAAAAAPGAWKQTGAAAEKQQLPLPSAEKQDAFFLRLLYTGKEGVLSSWEPLQGASACS